MVFVPGATRWMPRAVVLARRRRLTVDLHSPWLIQLNLDRDGAAGATREELVALVMVI
jgi:hypothetical protein